MQVTPPRSPSTADAPCRDPSVWTATGAEVPVFFDHSGRRRHFVAGGALLTVMLAATWLGGLLGGTVGFATLPSPVSVLRAPLQARTALAPVRARADEVAPLGGVAHDIDARTVAHPVYAVAAHPAPAAGAHRHAVVARRSLAAALRAGQATGHAL